MNFEIHLTTAAAGNPIYWVGAPDGLGVYISARPRGLDRRLRRAKVRVQRDYERRLKAFA